MTSFSSCAIDVSALRILVDDSPPRDLFTDKNLWCNCTFYYRLAASNLRLIDRLLWTVWSLFYYVCSLRAPTPSSAPRMPETIVIEEANTARLFTSMFFVFAARTLLSGSFTIQPAEKLPNWTCAARERRNKLTAIGRPTFRSLLESLVIGVSRPPGSGRTSIVSRGKPQKIISSFSFSSDTPTVNLNCANFHSFSRLQPHEIARII